MPNLVDVTYAQTGKSLSTNSMGMRDMQARAFEARSSQYLLLKAPPASVDWLSMRRNLELNLATSHAPAVEDLLNKVFDRDFEKSIEMTEPFPENWSDYLVRIMASRL